MNLAMDNSNFRGKCANKLKTLEVQISTNFDIRLPQSLNYKLKTDDCSKIRMY